MNNNNNNVETKESESSGTLKPIFKAMALHDFEATRTDTLSFEKGDEIRIYATHSTGWWVGEIGNLRGSFVSNLHYFFLDPNSQVLFTKIYHSKF